MTHPGPAELSYRLLEKKKKKTSPFLEFYSSRSIVIYHHFCCWRIAAAVDSISLSLSIPSRLYPPKFRVLFYRSLHRYAVKAWKN
uniref:Uncharacterized protein n=1 Tax=Salix viminalis TaxID=40686 RepID=A0A6N2LI61_SALVM